MSYHEQTNNRTHVSTPGGVDTHRVRPVFPKHWLIVEEVEKLAMREVEEASPRYDRGKRLKRRGYAGYRFLKVSRW
ncbi:hypothetical protein L3N51_02063 [Metallosphaera sp. J1]|uniref:hypothetical protein n=1 Tax=Metallosphaera javensis (ex Hofmann et al. 2022) TaxID=99938 RepID=UPI001EDEA655|nr:hypothetical protein [Metallosphaera javensis (ex Hofmann et al. 2022)]MCG3109767.1 hypothetical protein [Metallosphaera javensis (ex Hofmann et al. 2022)]